MHAHRMTYHRPGVAGFNGNFYQTGVSGLQGSFYVAPRRSGFAGILDTARSKWAGLSTLQKVLLGAGGALAMAGGFFSGRRR